MSLHSTAALPNLQVLARNVYDLKMSTSSHVNTGYNEICYNLKINDGSKLLMMTLSNQNNLLIISPWHTYWISFLM
jgi:hypothetical protein